MTAPRTADGVVLVEGMTVWAISGRFVVPMNVTYWFVREYAEIYAPNSGPHFATRIGALKAQHGSLTAHATELSNDLDRVRGEIAREGK